MPQRKQPKTLFNITILSIIELLNSTSENIITFVVGKRGDELEYISLVQKYLHSMLPVRLFEELCEGRLQNQTNKGSYSYIQLRLLTHPMMNILRLSPFLDYSLTRFIITLLPTLEKLVVLDLGYITTDSILSVVGESCPHLEILTATSKYEIAKSEFNAAVLVKNVSNEGLSYIHRLKKLRIVTLDSPRNSDVSKYGKGITVTGLRELVNTLPLLEELRTNDKCLISVYMGKDSGFLYLRKLNCMFNLAEDVKKLISLCPSLKELGLAKIKDLPPTDPSIVPEDTFSREAEDVLNYISSININLIVLKLEGFPLNQPFSSFLSKKGSHLLHLKLSELSYALRFDEIVTIGSNCPNLIILQLSAEWSASVPSRKDCMPYLNCFQHLEEVAITRLTFNHENIILYFISCSKKLKQLCLSFKKGNRSSDIYNNMVCGFLQNGCLKRIERINLHSDLYITTETLKNIIYECKFLKFLGITSILNYALIEKFILDNNYDLKLKYSIVTSNLAMNV